MDMETNGENGSLVLIKQGAEARVFESTFAGKKSVVKERFAKKYRHPTLDSKLTLKRLNAEARCTTKARRLGVTTPVLYAVDPISHTLTFEYVEGPSIKDILLDFGLNGIVEEKMDDIALQIGDTIGKLHDGGVVHGDLTTSNMLWRSDSNQLAFAELLEEGINIPAWFAFNSKDGVNVVSGDSLAECVAIADACKKVVSVGINCTPPRFIGGLISTIKKVTSKPILIYPNSGECYDAQLKQWVQHTGVPDEDFVSYVNTWCEMGASLVGGCCRTTPDTIRAIHNTLPSRSTSTPLVENIQSDPKRVMIKTT